MDIPDLASRAQDLRVAVLGDWIVDRYVMCESMQGKASDETQGSPLREKFTHMDLGGVMNIAAALDKAGVGVDPVTLITGPNPSMSEAVHHSPLSCMAANIATRFKMVVPNHTLPMKTRVYDNNRCVLRYDRESPPPDRGPMIFAAGLLDWFRAPDTPNYDALIVGDYRKGCFSGVDVGTHQSILNFAIANLAITIWDTKYLCLGNDPWTYKYSLAKTHIREAQQVWNKLHPDTPFDLHEWHKYVLQAADRSIVTMGAQGLSLAFYNVDTGTFQVRPYHPPMKILRGDTLGIGDVFTAYCALGWLLKLQWISFASAASLISLMHVGCYRPNFAEVCAVYETNTLPNTEDWILDTIVPA